MRNVFILTFFLVISCKKNCQDCGPITTGRYFIKNEIASNLTLVFYGSKEINFKKDTILLSTNERRAFLYFTTGKQPSSILNSNYQMFDSLHIFTNNQLLNNFKKNICIVNNVLCTSNYFKVKEETIKNNTKNIEYELAIR